VENKNKKRIGVLRGGAGKHYENSLKKGGEVIAFIFQNLSDQYRVVDILVDKEGTWHAGGLPVQPENLANKIDLVWNVSHPNFNNVLKNLPISNIRLDSSPIIEQSRIMLNKNIKNFGIKIPEHIVFPVYQKDFDGPREKYANKKAREVLEKFGAPWIVRSFNSDLRMGPVRGREGSQRPSASNGMGVHVAKTFPELVKAIKDGVSHEESILVEELIAGKSATVHSINNFRGESVYSLPAVEDRDGMIVAPGNFKADEKDKLIKISKKIHQHLNASHYTKFDFILHRTKGIYLINMEFLPDLKQNSGFTESCESVGAKAEHLLSHIIELSLNRKI